MCQQHRKPVHMANRIAIFASFLIIILISACTAAHSHGRCDGFHGCRCGTTAARYASLPFSYHGCNLKQASEWRRCFPRSAPAPGMVVYQHGGGPTGHVSTIVSVTSHCNATVKDDAGTYERNICARGGIVLDPNGNRARVVSNRTQSAWPARF